MKAMLAGESISEEELNNYIYTGQYVMQPKHDGHRIIIAKTDNKIDVFNRNGEVSQHSTKIKEAFDRSTLSEEDMDLVLDMEYLPDAEFGIVFDCLIGGLVTKETAYSDRLSALDWLIPENDPLLLKVASAFSYAQMARMVSIINSKNGEGVMLKKLDSYYHPGMRSREWIKCKRTKTFDAVVLAVHVDDQQKFAFGALDADQKMIPVGTAKQLIDDLKVNDVVEIRYLKATENRRLTQPVLLRRRDDKKPEECTLTQVWEHEHA